MTRLRFLPVCKKAALPCRCRLSALVLSVGTIAYKAAISTSFDALKWPEITHLKYGITQIKLSGMELSCGVLLSLRSAAIEAASI